MTPSMTRGVHGQEIIPGTELMSEDARFLPSEIAGREIQLIPHPSEDPKDPLNWSRPWKYSVIATQWLYLFISVESALAMGPMFPLFAAEFDLNDTQLSLLTGICVIALGYANFLIVPFSNIFGRRLTSILFCGLGMASCIWQALAKSYGSLLGGRALNGIATATSETLMVQVVTDMLFLHERGLWTGLYFTGYFMGVFIGPVISGNIAQRHGWRSFFWLSLALACFNLITLLVCFPETKFRREQPIYFEANAPVIAENNLQEMKEEGTSEQIQTIEKCAVGAGRPSKSQFGLWQVAGADWKGYLFRDIISPLRLFFFPIIFWAGLNVAGPANVLLYWNLTESPVLSASPYKFSPSAVGYTNFAFAVGGLIGLITAGPFSDCIAMRATARNSGVREAEMRLPALIPYCLINIIGLVIGGLGYERHWAWPAIVVIGYGCSGLCTTTIPTICIAYAVDCYKPMSGEIMVVATVLKNTCGFGMSYWVIPLATREGYMVPTMVEFSLTVGPALLAIPIYFYGKHLRRLTKNSNVHLYA